MSPKHLIISLILQDLKHSQLTGALKDMGLEDGGLYTLDLMDIVAQLMQVPTTQLEVFTSIYGGFLDRATDYPVTFSGATLVQAAKSCYQELKGCLG